MTPIKMLRLFRISPDGVRVETWSAGSEHVVNDNTLAILIGEGACEIVENKAMDAAPENKAQPKRRGRRKAQR